MRILAVDPGNDSGIVYVEWDGHRDPELLDFAQVLYEEMPHWMDLCLRSNVVDLIVYERFQISARTIKHSRQPDALYNIGGILYLAKLHDIPTREQNSSDAKDAYPDERIASYGIKGRHAKDAMRHALLATHARDVYSMCTDTDKTGSISGKHSGP